MICLIAAHAKNKVIGNKGHIPWSLPSDQQRFKEITLGGILIMGRRTFEEIYKKFGHGLPGRQTIVISKSQNFEGAGFQTAGSLPAALELAGQLFPQKDLFICGGESLYREALSSQIVDKMYISEIDYEPEGDTFFPDFEKKDYKIIKKDEICDSLRYIVKIYERKKV